jgi:hypothetical protein
MSPLILFAFGMVVFGLLLTGLFFTMAEFHRVTTRPDLEVGIPSDSAKSSNKDLAA